MKLQNGRVLFFGGGYTSVVGSNIVSTRRAIKSRVMIRTKWLFVELVALSFFSSYSEFISLLFEGNRSKL